jgi:hypothetical protein
MIAAEKVSLEEYYYKLYGMPKNDNEAVQKLTKTYQKLMKRSQLTPEVTQGIAEQYRILNNKNLPAFIWMMEAFHMLSKKSISKQTFPYAVGMLRQWAVNGFGYMPKPEDEEVFNYFLDVTRLAEASIESKKVLCKLMAEYGVVKLTRVIGEFKRDTIDISKVFVDILGEAIKNKFGVPMVVFDKSKSKVEFVTDDNFKVITEQPQAAAPITKLNAKRQYNRKGKDQIKSESKAVYDFILKNQKAQKLSDIIKATSCSIEWTDNPSRKMLTIMNNQKSIVRAGYGQYAIKSLHT